MAMSSLSSLSSISEVRPGMPLGPGSCSDLTKYSQASRFASTGLFLGGITARLQAEQLQITHVLSVLNFPDDRRGDAPGRTRLVIPVDDLEHVNLLQHLPACIAFIKQALGSGHKVLVHCAMGISRSCTVVTAYLMATENLSADAALEQVREKRPICCPNDGFLEQLQAFQAMGGKLVTSHPAYKKFRLQSLADQWQEHSSVDRGQLPEPSQSGGQVLLLRQALS